MQAAKFSVMQQALQFSIHYIGKNGGRGERAFPHTCFLRDDLLLASTLFDIELDQWQAIFLPVP